MVNEGKTIIDKIEGYEKLIRIIEKYKLEDMEPAKRTAKKQVFIAQFADKYHIVINEDNLSLGNGFWTKFGTPLGNMAIGTYGEKYNRVVANNTQDMEEEILLHISFPTGAYSFGDDRPTKFFERFYSELKTYEPKYCDDLNHGLYFSMDNAAKIHSNYWNICNKYIKENRNDYKRRRADALRKEAECIEKELCESEPREVHNG